MRDALGRYKIERWKRKEGGWKRDRVERKGPEGGWRKIEKKEEE